MAFLDLFNNSEISNFAAWISDLDILMFEGGGMFSSRWWIVFIEQTLTVSIMNGSDVRQYHCERKAFIWPPTGKCAEGMSIGKGITLNFSWPFPGGLCCIGGWGRGLPEDTSALERTGFWGRKWDHPILRLPLFEPQEPSWPHAWLLPKKGLNLFFFGENTLWAILVAAIIFLRCLSTFSLNSRSSNSWFVSANSLTAPVNFCCKSNLYFALSGH